MSKIMVLPEELANQVCAGEAVQYPSSVVKELVENAVDAGAKTISIQLEMGGKSYIGVQDDGHGLSEKDLKMLVVPHATSKIVTLDDLESVMTMGFRGEAMASIASVSRLSVKTKTKDAEHGWDLVSHAETSLDPNISPSVKPPRQGTLVEVKDLFYRVPGRQKFLSSVQSELRRVKEVVRRLALAHPGVAISLGHEGKSLMEVRHCGQKLEAKRWGEILGHGIIDGVIECEHRFDWGKVYGLCAKPMINRAQADMQYFIVNSRPIKDKHLSFAMKRAYSDLMPPGRMPIYTMVLEMDPKTVDVNVHPSKEEVRFEDVQAITRSLKAMVSNGLLIKKSTHYISSPMLQDGQKKEEGKVVASIGTGVEKNVSADMHRVTHGELQFQRPIETEAQEKGIGELRGQNNTDVISKNRKSDDKNLMSGGLMVMTDEVGVGALVGDSLAESGLAESGLAESGLAENGLAESGLAENGLVESGYVGGEISAQAGTFDFKPKGSLYLGHAIGQLAGIYILAQHQDGLLVVDMHAAHERILYEKLKNAYGQDGIKIQRRLVPSLFSADDMEIDIVEKKKLFFEQLGLLLDTDKKNMKIKVVGSPCLLGDAEAETLAENVIKCIIDFGEDEHIQDQINHVLATMACHRAIRANRLLSMAEMNALLREIEKTEHSDYCNHGRPTWFVWDYKKIDALFRRGQ